MFARQLDGAGGTARALAPQLARCGTSIAAMLEEARAAESRRDFISKCCIALKEARETHVRLTICLQTALGPSDQVRALTREADELVAILTVIIRHARENAGRR